MVFVYGALTVVCWGTWIGVSQMVDARHNEIRTFYVTLGNFVLAASVLLMRWDALSDLSWKALVPPLAGGVLWTLGNLCAFSGTTRIGIARAAGVWTPLNIAMGFLWGVLLFGEFSRVSAGEVTALAATVLAIILGLLLIVFAKGGNSGQGSGTLLGVAAAGGAGLLWGTYFVPVKASAASSWVANFPLAVGMLAGATALVLFSRTRPVLTSRRDYLMLSFAGTLWGTGNLGMLFLVEAVGAGKGFTIAQLSLLLNAVVGIYFFRDPPPRSRATAITVFGILLAGSGGVLLGNLK
ncbi:MAG TPA: GRP family sugar transporter [Micromonosporaceae bacterium]